MTATTKQTNNKDCNIEKYSELKKDLEYIQEALDKEEDPDMIYAAMTEIDEITKLISKCKIDN